jgi:hypothetical protein
MLFTSLIDRLNSRPNARDNRKSANCGIRNRAGYLARLEALEQRTVLSTLTVVNLLDSSPGSLRAAITTANANPGADTIKFAGGLKGTIMLASELAVTDDLTIDGNGAGKLTVSGGGTTRVFHASGASTHLAIDSLTIADGSASAPGGNAFGGGLLNEGATVSLSHVVMSNNKSAGAQASGGAVANLAGAHFSSDQTDYIGNTAQGDAVHLLFGGAVFDDQGASADIQHATFSGNSVLGGSANGGAIGQVGGGQLTVGYSTFTGNHDQGGAGTDEFIGGSFGGAIEAQSTGVLATAASTLTITHCTFTGNQALVDTAASGQDSNGQGNGGAIDVEDGTVATVGYCSFAGNLARGGNGGDGGGFGGASFGGAISNASSTLNVNNSRFTSNTAQGGSGGAGGPGGDGGGGNFGLGGAISCTALISDVVVLPMTTISNCQFYGNHAIGGDGGAGGSGGNGGDASRGDGGAVINLIGTMSVSNSTIAGNASQGGAGGAAGSGAGTVGGSGGLTRGGGFSNERGGTATLLRTSILNNTATGGAGANGGTGGDALGGGVFNGRPTGAGDHPDQAAMLTIIDSIISGNIATGGAGGNGFGGGIFNGNPVPVTGTPTLVLLNTEVTGNQAVGGACGTDGVGQGGGLYNQDGAVADVDAFTEIVDNLASTSDDDIFGTITPI